MSFKTFCVPGFGNIELSTKRSANRPDVQGVLHDMNKLAVMEFVYMVKDVVVDCGDGHAAIAKAFVVHWSARLSQEVSPTQDYMRKLCEGAATFKLTQEYQVTGGPHAAHQSLCSSSLQACCLCKHT
jgi:hypothetical protein